jgi:hypothetical protein
MGLVKKHWDRLPIGTYVLMAHRSRLPVKSITPSNQLSYVVRLGFAGQGLLVSGDAGCVDFRPSAQADFTPNLLKPLLPLHVIQVAHHGGNNADFYNVLVDCGYGQQTAPSWLLLSHATEDKYRPSPVFGSFIGEVRKAGDDMRLLFTSRPSADKVRDYLPLINPPTGAPADVGDVRLCFDGHDWKVQLHAVQVH